MPLGAFSVEDFDNRFSYHPPPYEGVAERHESAREGCRALAEKLARLCPPGRELALAVTALEEVMMWANAAIARDPDAVPARASVHRGPDGFDLNREPLFRPSAPAADVIPE